MNQTTATSIRLNTKIKQDAQLLAKEMGTNLSTVANIFFADFVRNRRLHIQLDEEGFTKEEGDKILKAVADYKSWKVEKVKFDSMDDFIQYLETPET